MGQASRLRNILVVEDEFLISEVISQTLDRSRITRSTPWRARKLACNTSKTARAVDLLFTDINLPGEMDGVGLAERARKLEPQLPVVYASGRWGMLEQFAVDSELGGAAQALQHVARLRDGGRPARRRGRERAGHAAAMAGAAGLSA